MSSKAAPAPAARRPQSANTVPGVKTPCQIHPSAIIADKARITGSHVVEIGENTVIHPYAEINANGGKVIIGRYTIVSERAVVGIATDATSGQDQAVVLGDGVNVEVGAVVEAESIGDGTTVDIKARVGKGAVVGKHCKVGQMEEVKKSEKINDFTVIHSNGQRRVDQTTRDHAEVRNAKTVGQEKTVDLLRRLIPNAASKWS